MTDYELALRYLPHFYRDTREPFPIEAVGYSVLREEGKSPSSPRMLTMRNGAEIILEYAIFYDFDIQHLYDLEHVFIYLDRQRHIVDVEASFHGWFFKSMFLDELKFDRQTHPVFYMQPGKHAMMPDPHHFYLYRELYDACGPLCGSGGFLVDPMFQSELSTNAALDDIVRTYLQKNFTFVPSMQFEPAPLDEAKVMPFEKLHPLIVRHMRQWVTKLKGGALDG